LTATHNEFPLIDVPDEPSECLNLYYDYKIETCLQNYEDKFEANVGFYGHDASLNTTNNYALRQSINKDNKPDKNDATSSWNVYWKVYGNL
jgi:hypothetical protein